MDDDCIMTNDVMMLPLGHGHTSMRNMLIRLIANYYMHITPPSLWRTHHEFLSTLVNIRYVADDECFISWQHVSVSILAPHLIIIKSGPYQFE